MRHHHEKTFSHCVNEMVSYISPEVLVHSPLPINRHIQELHYKETNSMESTSTSNDSTSEVRPGEALEPSYYNDFEQVRAILAPYHQIYNIALLASEMKRVVKVSRTDPPGKGSAHEEAAHEESAAQEGEVAKEDTAPHQDTASQEGTALPYLPRNHPGRRETHLKSIPTYTVHKCPDPDENESAWAKGMNIFDPSISPELQDAILKFSTCDFATFSFLEVVKSGLQVINARVEWRKVNPKPLFLLTDEGEEVRDTAHSVLRITTASGARYVADFSIEQFGHDGKMWFLTEAAYCFYFTFSPATYPPSEADRAEMKDLVKSDPFFKELFEAVENICATADWQYYHTLPAKQREAFIEAHTRGFFGEWSF